jgi:predicted ribosomally synthesized peptide with SipW-like signal peptide
MGKKLAASGLAVLGVLAFGIGGTYAAFSSTTDGPNTLAQAGTLDLKLSTAQNGVIQPIAFQNLKPGDSRFYYVQLTNNGTVPGAASWSFDNVQELENGCVPAETAAGDTTCGNGPQDGELGDQLAVTFSLMPGPGCTGTPQVLGPASFPSADSRVFKSLNGLRLAPGAGRCVRADVVFQNFPNLPNQPNNNQAQSDSSKFGFRFQLVS